MPDVTYDVGDKVILLATVKTAIPFKNRTDYEFEPRYHVVSSGTDYQELLKSVVPTWIDGDIRIPKENDGYKAIIYMWKGWALGDRRFYHMDRMPVGDLKFHSHWDLTNMFWLPEEDFVYPRNPKPILQPCWACDEPVHVFESEVSLGETVHRGFVVECTDCFFRHGVYGTEEVAVLKHNSIYKDIHLSDKEKHSQCLY